MKKTLLNLSMLLLFMIVGLGSAWADDVTFTFKTDEDITYTKTGTSGGGAKCIVSKSNVTLSGTNAYTDAAKSLNVYANSTLTITAPGNITAIALEYNGKVYPFDEAVGDGKKGEKFSASGAHPATYTPASSSTSVTLTNSNGGKTELLSLKVTYAAGAVVDVTGVSLSETSKTIMATEKFTLTATVAPADATNKLVKWSSDDETIAKVVDGVVTGLKAGTATITVSTLDGSKTASCEVTVTAKEKPAGAVFYESFDGCDGYGGNDGVWSNITLTKKFEYADNEGWSTEGYMASGKQCASIRKSTDATGGTDKNSGLTTPAIGVAGDGNITFNAQSWGNDTGDFYIAIVGGGTFSEADGVSLTNNSTTAKIALTKKSEWVKYDLGFTGLTADSKFRFYMAAGKRGFLDEVVVYVEASDEPKYTSKHLDFAAHDKDGYWATFSSDKVTFFPNDVTVNTVVVENGIVNLLAGEDEVFEEDIVTINEETVDGYYVPANTGVLVYSVETSATYYEVEYKTVEEVDADFNMLRPASVEMETDGSYKFYKLSYKSSALDALGFYYGKEGGAAFTMNNANGAYLAVPSSSAGNVKAFVLAEGSTGIDAVAAKIDANAQIYNVAGQRVSSVTKGLYIQNGKKFFVK